MHNLFRLAYFISIILQAFFNIFFCIQGNYIVYLEQNYGNN